MRVRELIFATLSTVAGMSSASGCWFYGDCGGEDPFELDETVSASDVHTVMNEYGHTSAEDVTCEELCNVKNGSAWHYQPATIDSCTHDISAYDPELHGGGDGDGDGAVGDETGDGDGDNSPVVGMIRCSGKTVYECIGGRRPLGHIEVELEGDDRTGRALAAAAHMEAASVLAFEELAVQLQSWGAPETLLQRCLEAADDERRHAQLLTKLAVARGARLPALKRTRDQSTPDLLRVALHNATEGCVTETWAALLAHHQGEHAHDEELRLAYRRIAVDEARHGQLAWDLHQWFLEQLSDDDAARVERAQREALGALPQLAIAQAKTLPDHLGAPSPMVAEASARDFARRLAS